MRRSSATLLDGLNLAALTYGAGLLVLIGFESNNYLTLPVQWLTVLDLCFVWAAWISPALELSQSGGRTGLRRSAGIDRHRSAPEGQLRHHRVQDQSATRVVAQRLSSH